MKNFLRQFIPPILLDGYRQLKGRDSKLSHSSREIWTGDYSNWAEAENKTGGYADQQILSKCRSALLKVKNGEIAYERDSVIFDKIQYSWPLLACLEKVALDNGNALHIIDFGGSLGSSYFQNRHFLKNLGSFKWIVVEQKHFVDCGKMDFEDAFLQFEYSIEEALAKQPVHGLLLSSVLPYLPDPFDWIDSLCNYNIDYIILDRTSLIDTPRTTLTIQNVPEEIYQASYPCWFFNEAELIKRFSFKYDVITDFDDSFTSPVLINGHKGYWKGFFLKKK